jgi:hypothetical protein
MEIIKIFLGLFLFFYLDWVEIFYLITGTIVYFYFKYNPFLQNSSYEYNFIYSMIYSIDFIFNVLNYLWTLIIENNYINYLPLKLEELNNKYLQYKMKVGFYLLSKLTNVFFSFYRKETSKNKVKESKNEIQDSKNRVHDSKNEIHDSKNEIHDFKKNITKIKLDTNEEMASFLDKIEYNLKNKAN